MAKIQYFDNKSEKNRKRVQKHRQRKKLKSLHENMVRERIELLNKIEINGSVDEKLNGIEMSDNDGVFDFCAKLKYWVVQHRITASAITGLLKILIAAGFGFLPKDSRTFMRTPTNLPITVLENGKMWYNGIKRSIENVLCSIDRDITITLNFNFDGLPIFKSSKLQFWPILAAIQGTFAFSVAINSIIIKK